MLSIIVIVLLGVACYRWVSFNSEKFNQDIKKLKDLWKN
jgi:hypothetical protein